MKKWEYKVVSPNLFLGDDPFDEDSELSSQHLNQLGAEGWELISVESKSLLGVEASESKTPKIPTVFIFKREC